MSSKGLFIPTTQVWDVSDVQNLQGESDSLKELLVRMYQNLNLMAMAINYKDTGIYPTEEFVCGQQYFPEIGLDSSSSRTPKLRPVTRRAIPWIDVSTGLLKPLPNATSSAIPHGITFDVNSTAIRVFGAAYDPVAKKLISLPWVADSGDNIAVWLDATNLNIKTFTSNRTNFTKAQVIVEFLKF